MEIVMLGKFWMGSVRMERFIYPLTLTLIRPQAIIQINALSLRGPYKILSKRNFITIQIDNIELIVSRLVDDLFQRVNAKLGIFEIKASCVICIMTKPLFTVNNVVNLKQMSRYDTTCSKKWFVWFVIELDERNSTSFSSGKVQQVNWVHQFFYEGPGSVFMVIFNIFPAH